MRIAVLGKRLLVPLLSFALAQAEAATFYVSTQGSDSNPGTASQPFRTITYAYSIAGAGSTILVLPGVYTDYTSGWGLHLGKSGTASSAIVLRSQTPGGAAIDGLNASDRNQGIYLDGSYNIVDGFEIRNGPKGGVTIGGNNNQILNCTIHNNGNSGSSPYGQDGIYSDEGTSGTVYKANYVHHNGRPGSNLDHGLYLCGDNESIINNIVLANAACGLQIAGYTTVSNMKVYNNVMAWNGTDGIILWQALSGVDIKNNVFYGNGHWAIGSYAATGNGVSVDHNLSFSNVYGSFNLTDGGSTCTYTIGTNLYTDPRFTNAASASFDAHLMASSPAIQTGLNLCSVFTNDMCGAARQTSGLWDLGVYAYASADNSGSTTSPTITLGISAAAGGINLTWNSVSNKTYRVATKSQLTDAWTDLSSNIIANGAASSWTDTTAGTAPQRFYTVYSTN